MSKLGRILTVISFFVLFCGAAHAETIETSKGEFSGKWDRMVDYLNNNEEFYHTHHFDVEFPERDNPVGVGVDLVLFENEKETFSIGVEGRYDTQNDEVATYAVAKINLWKLFRK